MADFVATNVATLDTAIASAGSGDRIIINGTIKAGGRTFPAGITLTSDTPGGGTLDCPVVSSEMDENIISANTTVENLIFSSSDAGVATGGNYQGGNDPTNLTTGFMLHVVGDNAVFNHCIFKDRARTLVRQEGADSTYYHCYFEGGFYSLYLLNLNADGVKVTWCWFDWGYEGVKCVGGGPVALPLSDGSKTPDVTNSYFNNFARDAFDLTKGWRNLWVQDCLLIRSSIDAKTVWDVEGEEAESKTGWNMLFERCHFLEPPRNPLIITHLQQVDPNWMDGSIVTPAGDEYGAGAVTGLGDALYWSPREIELRDCIFEGVGTGGERQLVWFKAGRDVQITNPVIRGGLENVPNFSFWRDTRQFENGGTIDGALPLSLSGYALNNTVTGETYDPTPSGTTFPPYDQSADPASEVSSVPIRTATLTMGA